MPRLRKQIPGLHGRRDAVVATIALHQSLRVPGLRHRIARHVHDAAGAKGAQLLQKIGRAALAGRIDNDRGGVAVLMQAAVVKHGFGHGGAELAVGNVVGDGVGRGLPNGLVVDFDANDRVKVGGGRQSKQSRAAVAVDEVGHVGWTVIAEVHHRSRRVLDHLVHQEWQDVIVVLKKVPGLVGKVQAPDRGRQVFLVVGGDDDGTIAVAAVVVAAPAQIVLPKEQRGALATLPRFRQQLGAHLLVAGVDLRCGNRAGRHVHKLSTRLALKANLLNHFLLVVATVRGCGSTPSAPFGSVEVRRQLAPVSRNVFRAGARGHLHDVVLVVVPPLQQSVLLQRLPHHVRLPRPLPWQRPVLELTAAAVGRQGTDRLDAIGTWFQNRQPIGLAVIGKVAKDADPDALTGNDVWDEDDPFMVIVVVFVVAVVAIVCCVCLLLLLVWQCHARHAPTAVRELLNGDFQFLVVRKGKVDKLGGCGRRCFLHFWCLQCLQWLVGCKKSRRRMAAVGRRCRGGRAAVCCCCWNIAAAVKRWRGDQEGRRQVLGSSPLSLSKRRRKGSSIFVAPATTIRRTPSFAARGGRETSSFDGSFCCCYCCFYPASALDDEQEGAETSPPPWCPYK